MPTSNASVFTSKMELTPMRVNFKGVDLGGTLGNVVIKPDFSLADIKADQSGETVRDRRVSGFNVSIVTELVQIKDKSIWKTVFPHAHLVDDGFGHQSILFQNNIGDSQVNQAGILILHPLSLADADLSGDYKFYLAAADAKSEIVYGPKEQAKLKITWNVYPDSTTTPERFFVHGDPSIGVVDASAGSPVFVGTGNGTVSPVSVDNGFTKTETITIQCVGQTSGNNFYVSGSVSGAIGEFHVASASGSFFNFVSNEINFTLTQGTVQFVLNDAFTIATVAANYV